MTTAPDAPRPRASRRRTWVIVLVTIAGLAVAGTVTLVGLGVYIFTSHVDIADADAETAVTRFEEARARFAGAEPLIHLGRDNGDIRAEVRRPAQPSEVQPEALHLLVWNPREERLVNVRIPLWLLRLSDDGTVSFSEAERDVVGNLDVTVADIDHHGPGLVLDYQDEDGDGERILLWAE